MVQSTQIQIYGKVYNIKSKSFSVDPQEVAKFVDMKMRELSSNPGRITNPDLAILVAINIANELLDLQKEKKVVRKSEKKKIDKMISLLNRELMKTQP